VTNLLGIDPDIPGRKLVVVPQIPLKEDLLALCAGKAGTER
jgi:hypothetical protein